METEAAGVFDPLWILLSATEFWSAIVGVIAGGLIAYAVQMKALREGREQREEDRKRTQQALGNALLFKVVRIHSNICNILRHIDTHYEKAAKSGRGGEPWQFVRQLANPPAEVHFTSEEMGMLLALKDDVFNDLVSMDVSHNSLRTAIEVFNRERRVLMDRLKPDAVEGTVASGMFDKELWLTLRPRMASINELIEEIRTWARSDAKKSRKAIDDLQKVLKDRLGLANKVMFKENLQEPTPPAR